jgi:hypothetical protein
MPTALFTRLQVLRELFLADTLTALTSPQDEVSQVAARQQAVNVTLRAVQPLPPLPFDERRL